MIAFLIGIALVIFCFGCYLIGKHLQKKYKKNSQSEDDDGKE